MVRLADIYITQTRGDSMIKKIFKFISLLSILLFTASSIVAGTPKRGGTLVWSIGGTPRHLNTPVQ